LDQRRKFGLAVWTVGPWGRGIVWVCRPGGRIGLVNWTPEGQVGELFKIIGRYLPPPPGYASPPPLWGSEEHVRGLFADSPIELEFARGTNPWWEDCRGEILALPSAATKRPTAIS
jgi:hypothetical protein